MAVLGGQQTFEGIAFNQYLDHLYKTLSKPFPVKIPIRDMNRYVSIMEKENRSRSSTLMTILNLNSPNGSLNAVAEAKIETIGGLVLRDPDSNNPIAITLGSGIILIYHDPTKGFVPLFWDQISIDHPEWLMIDVTL